MGFVCLFNTRFNTINCQHGDTIIPTQLINTKNNKCKYWESEEKKFCVHFQQLQTISKIENILAKKNSGREILHLN